MAKQTTQVTGSVIPFSEIGVIKLPVNDKTLFVPFKEKLPAAAYSLFSWEDMLFLATYCVLANDKTLFNLAAIEVCESAFVYIEKTEHANGDLTDYLTSSFIQYLKQRMDSDGIGDMVDKLSKEEMANLKAEFIFDKYVETFCKLFGEFYDVFYEWYGILLEQILAHQRVSLPIPPHERLVKVVLHDKEILFSFTKTVRAVPANNMLAELIRDLLLTYDEVNSDEQA